MTEAEKIYHRFVQYEWNDISEGLKQSILDAINEALRNPPVVSPFPDPEPHICPECSCICDCAAEPCICCWGDEL